MKKPIFILLFFCFMQAVAAQQYEQPSPDSIAFFFEEVKAATARHTTIWSRDLYGPILLIDPQSRQLFANEPDSAGLLQPSGNIYTGYFPDHLNYANTSLRWSGKSWAMLMLPLSQNKQDRLQLMTHELFHLAQPELGFAMHNPENNHLDKKEGRIYLRLELEALKKALQSSTPKAKKQHLANALSFRKYRHTLYAGADTTENSLELSEGLAEYTGTMLSGRSKRQTAENFFKGINKFYTNPTFVRSFAYQTIPVYGYLLAESNQHWNKEINSNTNLTDYFIRAFQISLPRDLKTQVAKTTGAYGAKSIVAEEAAREEKIQQLTAAYKRKLVEQPHLEIPLEKMNISFDPRNILPLEDKGTVYPNLRITDLWGTLRVEQGALIGPDWSRVSLSMPTKIEDQLIAGEGWTLELAKGYKLTKDSATGNYLLSKQ